MSTTTPIGCKTTSWWKRVWSATSSSSGYPFCIYGTSQFRDCCLFSAGQDSRKLSPVKLSRWSSCAESTGWYDCDVAGLSSHLGNQLFLLLRFLGRRRSFLASWTSIASPRFWVRTRPNSCGGPVTHNCLLWVLHQTRNDHTCARSLASRSWLCQSQLVFAQPI